MNLRCTVLLLAIVTLTGCAGSNDLITQKLDPLTSVSITYSQIPMVFYRDDSGKAAFARSYVHMGPVEINRMGAFRYYLWLGIWNTIQGPSLDDSREGFESIVIFADGEPLTLELVGWSAESIGASVPVYLKPVSSSTDAYYEVTVDQLRLIAASSNLRIQSTGTRSLSYEPWDGQEGAKISLSEFMGNSVY